MAESSNIGTIEVTPIKRAGPEDLVTPDSKKRKGKGKTGTKVGWQRVLDSIEAHKDEPPLTRPGHPQTLLVGKFAADRSEEDIYVEWPKTKTANPEFRYFRMAPPKRKGSDPVSINIKLADIGLFSRYLTDGAIEIISSRKDETTYLVTRDFLTLSPDDPARIHTENLRRARLEHGADSSIYKDLKALSEPGSRKLKDMAAKERFNQPGYDIGSSVELTDENAATIVEFRKREQVLNAMHAIHSDYEQLQEEVALEVSLMTSSTMPDIYEQHMGMMVREAQAMGVDWPQTVRGRDLIAAVKAPISMPPRDHSSDPKLIHEMYKHHLSKFVFSKVLIKHDLVHEYLTKENPHRCLYAGPHESFTRDDRLVFRRFVWSTTLPEKVVLLQPHWKFYHALGLILADELQLGPIDMKWLILNQDAFRVAGLTQMKFVETARRYHEKRILLNGLDNSIIFDIFLLYYTAYHTLGQAVSKECSANEVHPHQNLDDLFRPDTGRMQELLLETFTKMQISARNYRLLSVLNKTSLYDTLAMQEYETLDPSLGLIKHHMKLRRMKPFGALNAKLSDDDRP
jgi:hypothetical protein